MLERDNVAVLIVDFQDKLLTKIFNAGAILPQAIKLIRFARTLDLPLLVSEQYPKGLGPTNEAVARELGAVDRLEKTSFGCLGDQGFAEALAGIGRRQLLVTGIETHVCVLQTVLGALDEGFQVFVAQDAVGSRRDTDHNAGLARMAKAGSELVTVEMAIFEILRDAATAEFKQILPLLK